jgi:hypothetical protein
MPIADWRSQEAWDYALIGGKAIAGIVRVDVELPSGLDVQKPKGGKKATIADEGTPPAELTIECEFVSPIQLENFQANIMPLIRPPAKAGARDPLEFIHPNAQLWGINVITVGNISSPTPRAGGSMVITISAVEWAPAPTPAKKPAKKPATGDPASEGWDNVDELINDLRPSQAAEP